jgi:hypothetical protein
MLCATDQKVASHTQRLTVQEALHQVSANNPCRAGIAQETKCPDQRHAVRCIANRLVERTVKLRIPRCGNYRVHIAHCHVSTAHPRGVRHRGGDAVDVEDGDGNIQYSPSPLESVRVLVAP